MATRGDLFSAPVSVVVSGFWYLLLAGKGGGDPHSFALRDETACWIIDDQLSILSSSPG